MLKVIALEMLIIVSSHIVKITCDEESLPMEIDQHNMTCICTKTFIS